MFSANGAKSAWGNAPGKRLHNNSGLNVIRRGLLHTRVESHFQRSFHFYRNPGALSQAKIENAPLALNRYETYAPKGKKVEED